MTRYNVEDNISSARMRTIPKNESEALLKKILDEKRVAMKRTKMKSFAQVCIPRLCGHL